MSLKKVLCLIVLGALVVAGAFANGGKEAGAPTTLVVVQPSDKTAIFDSLLPVIEKGLAADGVNVKLDVIFVPWSDLATKTQVMLAGQDNIDLIFDAPWLHMNQMIAQGYYEELTSLLNSVRPQYPSHAAQGDVGRQQVQRQDHGNPAGALLPAAARMGRAGGPAAEARVRSLEDLRRHREVRLCGQEGQPEDVPARVRRQLQQHPVRLRELEDAG